MVRGSNFGTNPENLVCPAARTGLRAMEIYGIASLVVSIQPTRSHNKMEWDQEELLFDPF
jgi:hypothetical protein